MTASVWRHSIRDIGLAVCTLLFASRGAAVAADWPQWRYDANRSAASPVGLSGELHLQWIREYPALEPAWEDPVNRDRMPFDRLYEPIVVGSTLLVGSNRSDRLTALDTRTGEERWRFYADGPVRLPPVAAKGKVYVVSDDGHLYCLSIETGELAWKRRGGPGGRKVLGNGRVISAWPVRGGPVLKDGIVYFAASIWPFMGVFIYAVDAETGKTVWINDGLGSTYMHQPHGGAVSFAGVAPQGSFAAIGGRLLVPGGRSVPACLDRQTGKLLYFHLSGSSGYRGAPSPSRKLEGGSHVSAIGEVYFNHRGLNTAMYDLDSGRMYLMWETTTYPVLTEEVCYFSGNPVVARSLKDLERVSYQKEERDRRTGKMRTVRRHRWEMPTLWECPVDGTAALIKAGDRLYAGGRGVVSAIDVSKGGKPKVSWRAEIEGTAARLVAADDRLFAVTLEGRIYAFGADKATPRTHPVKATPLRLPDDALRRAGELLKQTTIPKGLCLVFGLDRGDLAAAIAQQSELRVVAVDADAEKVAALRRRFDEAGLYGARVSVHVGDPTTFEAPPYIAVLTASENSASADVEKGSAFVRAAFASMRPYGGIARLPAADEAQASRLVEQVRKCGLEGAKVARAGRDVALRREGSLPGAGTWTHQYGNVANTVRSDDRRVRTPLGVLWFGGTPHKDVLPRHGHGPPEQILGGRLFIEGVNVLSARDVYTGAVLWRRTFDDLGTFGAYYDETYKHDPLDTSYNQVHIPGANARGSNYVATADRIYLAARDDCFVLDPVTGESIATFSLPAPEGTGDKPKWGYIGVCEDLLIATASPVDIPVGRHAEEKRITVNADSASASKTLVVMDRYKGKVLWSRQAEASFRHNAIVAGAGKVFCIDRMTDSKRAQLKRRGRTASGASTLYALDARTGKVVWQDERDVLGTWLGYAAEHDILLQSGRHSRDTVADEPPKGMIAYRGKDGSVLWDKPIEHGGPCMLHHDTVYTNAVSTEGSAVNLLTGELKTRKHPLTGEEIPWRYHRMYGCNFVIGSEHLLTFRSGAAGYYDLANDGGTGNLGGFRSGCTSNLIAADGVLNAPDYTRTCTCSYQNQTSLALVHAPDVEVWTFNRLPESKAPIRRVGLNFGAPGDRMADDGTLWLEMPLAGSPSPELRVVLEPPAASGDDAEPADFTGEVFRHHSSRVRSGALRWVAASGLIGVTRVAVTLGIDAKGERSYVVRLHFLEPEALSAGQRVFDVSLQDRRVLEDFDVVKAAGGAWRAVVKEFAGVKVSDVLAVSLKPKAGAAILCGLEAVVETE